MTIVDISAGGLSAAVNTMGAELWSVRTAAGEWLWQGDPAWWTGRAPILFPIVGRTFGGAISIDGKKYAMDLHGFGRRSEFSVVEARPASVRLRLVDSAETRKQYPFAFSLDLVFAVEDGKIVNRAEIRNTGSTRMPFSFGFHPAFAWPLPGGADRQHWLTLAEKEEPPTARLGEGLMMAPGHNASLFKAGRYAPKAADFEPDAVIMDELRSRSITFGADGGPSVVVAFADFPYLGIWQKPGAPYLCIEPWQGGTPIVGGSDAIGERPGNVWLDPGTMRSFTMTIAPHAAG